MGVIPLMLVGIGGYLLFCGITDRNPVDSAKQLLTLGTLPNAGTQTPKKGEKVIPQMPKGHELHGDAGQPGFGETA